MRLSRQCSSNGLLKVACFGSPTATFQRTSQSRSLTKLSNFLAFSRSQRKSYHVYVSLILVDYKATSVDLISRCRILPTKTLASCLTTNMDVNTVQTVANLTCWTRWRCSSWMSLLLTSCVRKSSLDTLLPLERVPPATFSVLGSWSNHQPRTACTFEHALMFIWQRCGQSLPPWLIRNLRRISALSTLPSLKKTKTCKKSSWGIGLLSSQLTLMNSIGKKTKLQCWRQSRSPNCRSTSKSFSSRTTVQIAWIWTGTHSRKA